MGLIDRFKKYHAEQKSKADDISQRAGQDVHQILPGDLTTKLRDILSSLDDDSGEPLSEADMVTVLGAASDGTTEVRQLAASIAQRLHESQGRWKNLLSQANVSADKADHALAFVGNRIGEDMAVVDNAATGNLQTVNSHMRELGALLDAEGLNSRFTILDLVQKNIPQITPFLNDLAGREAFLSMMTAPMLQNGTPKSSFEEKMGAFLGRFKTWYESQNPDAEALSQYRLAQENLHVALPQLRNQVTLFNRNALFGIVGEHAIGTDAVNEFVGSKGGVDALVSDIENGGRDDSLTLVRFIADDGEICFAWYPKGTPESSRPDQPAKSAERLKQKLTDGKIRGIIGYKTGDVMQWLRDLPEGRSAHLKTQVPSGGQWIDADVRIVGEAGEGVTIIVDAIHGVPESQIDERMRSIDPNFIGRFDPADAERTEACKNCVLQMFSRARGKFTMQNVNGH